MMSLIPDSVLIELQNRFGTSFSHLSKPEVQALVTAQLEGEVSNTRLQQLIDNSRAITQILFGLCRKALCFLTISVVGPAKLPDNRRNSPLKGETPRTKRRSPPTKRGNPIRRRTPPTKRGTPPTI